MATVNSIIDELVSAYGQLAGKRDFVKTIMKDLLLTLEVANPLPYQESKQTLNYTGGTLVESIEVSDAVDIKSVLMERQGIGKYGLIKVSREEGVLFRDYVKPNTFFYVERYDKVGVKLMFPGSVVDANDYTLYITKYLATDLADDDIEYPALNIRYIEILDSLRATLSYNMRDLDRLSVLIKKGE